ncbi:putative reverse transcriptase domain-containing protein [Tanacetum coccineum]
METDKASFSQFSLRVIVRKDLAPSSVRLATRQVTRPGTVKTKSQPLEATCSQYQHACGEKGYYKSQCSRANNNAHGRAYLLRDKNAHQDPNVVTDTFLLNQHLARVLFDSGADKSFVSISLASMINIPPITLDTTYDIEMADGNLVGTNTVIQAELHEAIRRCPLKCKFEVSQSLPLCGISGYYIRGQPGLDELDFDDLYNNLKVYEHELKGVSNSNSQNIAFLSTEVKGSTLKQSTAEPAHIPKGYTQAIRARANCSQLCFSRHERIICSFFAPSKTSLPTNMMMKTCCTIDEDAMEEIDIRWHSAMITAG